MLDAVKVFGGWRKYLFDQRGEVIDPGTNGAPAPVDWREPYKADPELAPFLEKRTEKDLPTFLKSSMNLEKRLGTSIVPPSVNATPQEIAAFKQKIYGAAPHVFKAPPESPDRYSLTKPDKIPENAWNSGIESEYRAWAHKHGISDEAFQEGFAIHLKQFDQVLKSYEIDNAEAAESLRTWAAEIKADPADIMSKADDFINRLAKDDPQLGAFIAETKMLPIGHPSTMKLIGTAALYAAESTGEIGGGSIAHDAEQAYQESKRIAADPSHPLYRAYHAGEGHPQFAEAVRQYEAGFRKKFGNQTIGE